MVEDTQSRLRDIVSVSSLLISPEVHNRLHSPEQQDNEDYMIIKRELQKILRATQDLRFAYTMRETVDRKIMFVCDAEENREDMAFLGDIYDEASPLLRENFSTIDGAIVEREFYTDNWGTWLTGYAPILDSAGNRVGVLGLDISAGKINAYSRSLFIRFLTLFAVLLPFALVLSWILGRHFSKPIAQLKAVSDRISESDFQFRADESRSDELGDLGRAFNMMASKLHKSIHHLKEEISERKKTEARLANIINNAVEGIFQSNVRGDLLMLNPTMLDLLGYERLEDFQAQGIKAEELYEDKSDRARFVEAIEQNGKVEGFRTVFRRKDGATVHVEMNAHLRNDTEHGTIIEGMLMDVSERLKREEAEKQREIAEAASKAKSVFLSNMSHEIRTPMNAIVGIADIMLRGDLTAKQKDYLKKLRSACFNLLGIINDILDFSKIEAGKLELEQIPFDLETVLNNLSTVISLKAEEKGLELLFDVDHDMPFHLIGDPLRLGQVMINLCGNAVKFTEQGHVLVKMSPSSLSEGQLKLRVEVKDTGIGIPVDKLSSIFSSFDQVDASITRQYGGTGLGLAISKQLVELMNGHIDVESEEGVGSCFSFEVELGIQDEAFLEDRVSKVEDLRVLVVDDNPISRQILSSNLVSFSMTVEEASSGYEALEKINDKDIADPFDLVLMDYRMPGMDGIEASKQIKDRKSVNDRVPSVLMITAFGKEEIYEQARNVGIEAFLNKPVNPSLLFNTILEVLGKSPVKDTSSQRDIELEEKICNIKGAEILIVEDNRINQEVVREILESYGFSVDIASNGELAFQKVCEQGASYDLVLMDLQMPVLDGYQATRKIRNSNCANAAIPIIALTAHAQSEERDKCLQTGMNGHLTKPIDTFELLGVLLDYIRPRATSAKTETQAKTNDHEMVQLPDDSEDLNVAVGLEMVRGNRKLYRKLLHDFAKDYHAFATSLTEVWSIPIEQLQLETHTLKSVAANLGAQALAEAAEKMDASLKSQAPEAEIQEHAANLGARLSKILNLLEIFFTSEPPGSAVNPEDFKSEAKPLDYREDATFLKAVHNLVNLTDQGDVEAIDALTSMEADFNKFALGKRFKEVNAALDEFDFSEASRLLKNLDIQV